MALVLADRVQQTGTANTTVSFTLSGTVASFQSFAVIGNTNTTFYAATDATGNWESGLGTYSTTGPTLTRTTIYASSNSGSAVTFSGTVNVFVTYPSNRAVYEDASGNVSALGTITSGVWNGSTIGVAYGGTGVTASSGASSVMLRDANQNVSINRLNQSNTSTAAAGATTALTAASSYSQTLTGTGGQTFTMPDATTLTTGVAFVFNNNATGTLTLQDYATGAIGTITAGGAVELVLLSNGTTAGTWDVHGYLPEAVTWGTNALNLGTTVITNGTWNGGTIPTGYGGTGLTTFTAANNALYSTSGSALAAGTLPVAAGGTNASTASITSFNNITGYTASGATGTTSTNLVFSTSPTITTPTISSLSSASATALTLQSAGTTAITVDTSQNVGIGTSSPAYKLSVAGSTVGEIAIQAINASSGNTGYRMANSLRSWAIFVNDDSSGPLRFYDYTASAERMRITSAGGVSFGATGTAYGTTGQVLQSNGNAAPTWGTTITSAVAGTGVSVSGATGAVTISIGQAVATSSNVQFNSLGVGTAGSATAGEIRATNNITAYYSDIRLKTKVGDITDPLGKVRQIETMLYHANETAVELGYDASIIEVGLSAQSVQLVQPEAVAPAPIDDKYLTVRYERLVPLLLESVKALEDRIIELEAKLKG